MAGLRLIDQFGDQVKPDQINHKKNTALILACHRGLQLVGLRLIDRFGEAVQPGQINIFNNTVKKHTNTYHKTNNRD